MQIDCVRACASPAYRLEYQVWRWLARPKESLIALSRSTSQFSGRGNVGTQVVPEETEVTYPMLGFLAGLRRRTRFPLFGRIPDAAVSLMTAGMAAVQDRSVRRK